MNEALASRFFLIGTAVFRKIKKSVIAFPPVGGW